jgi:hypothetical protein
MVVPAGHRAPQAVALVFATQSYIFVIACQWQGFHFRNNGTPPTSEILYG